jgi:hypothetical protein
MEVILTEPKRVRGVYHLKGDAVWIDNRSHALWMIDNGKAKHPPKRVKQIVVATPDDAPDDVVSQWSERVRLELDKERPHHKRLTALCDEAGLPTDGNNKDKIERLEQALA